MDRRRLRRIVKGLLLAGGLAALAGGGALFLLRPTPVTVGEVALRDLAPAVQGVGTVEARVVVQVGAKIAGRVVAVLADQGDTVRPGQVLARLDDAESVAQAEQAEASLQRARMAVAAQEAAFEKARAALAAAEAALSRVRATEALARINAERWRQLYAEGGVARADLDARVTEAVAAADELKNAEALRRAAGAEVEVLGAGLEMAHHDVRGAEAALAAARARQADTVVVSPLDGYVVSRELEPGATVNPGTPILKIADPRTAWVTVHVDERETGGIAVGDPAEIALRSLPGRTLPGRVARLQRESDRVTEQLAVDIAFGERPPRLILGEQAEATIRSGGARRVVALPLAALVRTPDGPGAWTVVDGRLRFRTARLGVADPAGWIEVVEGLRPGEQVVLAPGRLADPANEGRRVVAADQAGITAQAVGRP
jgi:HlyD family secretion protein